MNRAPRLVLSFALACAAIASGGCGPDYPNCNNDEQCHEHEFCVNHQCQQCRTDTDCPTGQQCTGGACAAIDGYCDTNSPCPSGQECVDNRCQASATSTDPCANVSCAAGTHCAGGACVDDAFVPSCQTESVYFEFDSDALDEPSRQSLQASARCIADSHPARVHATGLADSRGTEEYNLALSERRAIAVNRYLRSLGVSIELTQSGVGEEMSSGDDEAAWRRDRRVDLHQR